MQAAQNAKKTTFPPRNEKQKEAVQPLILCLVNISGKDGRVRAFGTL